MPASTTPLHVLIYTFDHARDETVKAAMRELRQHVSRERPNMAIVRKQADGGVEIRETHDFRPMIERIAGTVIGGAAWLVFGIAASFGPPAEQIVQEQVVEGVRAFVRDSGFPDDVLERIGERLDNGDAALIAIVPATEDEAILRALEPLGGHIDRHILPDDLAQRLA